MLPIWTLEKINEKLKRLRLRTFGSNVRLFERKTGVSRGSVPGIEAAKNFPRLDVLQKWVYGCDRTLGDFFDEPNPENPYSRDFKKYHDDLEYVLSTIGPEASSTVAALKSECGLLELTVSRSKKQKPKPPPEGESDVGRKRSSA